MNSTVTLAAIAPPNLSQHEHNLNPRGGQATPATHDRERNRESTRMNANAGLTIDEFALWVYLEDVYWKEEGRRSIDATVIAAREEWRLVRNGRPTSSRQ